jgi:probable H4MPT-linked C1 transfer pathway protein
MAEAVLGLDVGGANLKAAHSAGMARLRPFELWKNPGGLVDALKDLLQDWAPYSRLGLTMTGELCDCFESRRCGVEAILHSVELAAGDTPVSVWQSNRRFIDPSALASDPLEAAAANWLALATFAARFAPEGPALLIDIGSTTTDIVPLADGKPIPRGRNDRDRLMQGELVYTGVRRTPLCALLGGLAAAELFATTLDAYVVLGDIPEDPSDRATADGRPRTKKCALARLGRMFCLDGETCLDREARALAFHVRARQTELLRAAVARVADALPAQPRTIILAGSGDFLARCIFIPRITRDGTGEQAEIRLVSLTETLGEELSAAACAYAVAQLLAEQTP